MKPKNDVQIGTLYSSLTYNHSSANWERASGEYMVGSFDAWTSFFDHKQILLKNIVTSQFIE